MDTGEGNTVLVPAVDAPSAATCLRSLGRRGVRTVAFSERKNAAAFASRYCDEAVAIPSPAEDLEGYKDALLMLAGRDDVRTVVPMREENIYALSKYRTEFGEHVATPWPTFDTLRDVHDRVRLVAAAEEAGVPVPETQLLDEVDDWNRKLIVKSRYSILSNDYVDSIPSGETARGGSTRYLRPGREPDREAIREEMRHVPIVQEYVPGSEYALWALYDRGEPVATCQKHQIRAFSYAGGTSIFRETVRLPELERVGRALLDRLDWHGFASVQFKRDSNTGEFKLMEINPRVWVSVACAVRAGVDFPYYYWRLAGNEPVRVDAEYEEGVATHRIGGEAMYLYSVLQEDVPFVDPPPFPAALRDVVTSFYAHPRFDYLELDDARPFARDLLNWVGRQTGVSR
ncbi:carboxylate--amine ligase [Haladaptatus salinisoli]|uniref:carboxylate--amine ligase n=1 Tax=Haladaptatus salinisoli TaxID=2884876 RepID=UPI001D0B8259|nr:ATP-grasp domain-containing protein [Haladaptatus salinisoli]